jgi:hypothetical protein
MSSSSNFTTVILSAAGTSQREVPVESKDLYHKPDRELRTVTGQEIATYFRCSTRNKSERLRVYPET